MKKTLLIISILLLTGCTATAPPEETVEEIVFESIEEYIDAIHDEWPGENKFLFESGSANYSIEGFELVVDENNEPVVFENDQTSQYENAFFWIYTESEYETKGSSSSFYLRGLEGPRDAVYGAFKGNLAEMLLL